MNIIVSLFQYYLNMFPGVQLSIYQHWFRWWLSAKQATSPYLSQSCPSLQTHIRITRPQRVQFLFSCRHWDPLCTKSILPLTTLIEISKAVMLWINPSWWRHRMETFPALLAICAGNSPVPGKFPAQRPVMVWNFPVRLSAAIMETTRKWM